MNNSGNPAILSESGVILDETKIPRTMSNPLMTIESLSLQNPLDASNPSAKNTGRVTIRFYVRGSSKDDIVFLKEAIKERENILQKRIEIAITECKKRDILCNNKAKLEAFDAKYKELLRSLGGTRGKDESIYALANEVNSIKSLEEEFKDLIPNTVTQ